MVAAEKTRDEKSDSDTIWHVRARLKTALATQPHFPPCAAFLQVAAHSPFCLRSAFPVPTTEMPQLTLIVSTYVDTDLPTSLSSEICTRTSLWKHKTWSRLGSANTPTVKTSKEARALESWTKPCGVLDSYRLEMPCRHSPASFDEDYLKPDNGIFHDDHASG